MPLAAQSNEDELAALRLADEPAGRECAEDGGASAAGDAVSAQALSRAASDGAEEGNTGRASAPAHAARSASADGASSVSADAGEAKYEDACGGEDDTSASWRARSKHVLVVSDAGKPIYSRHGASERLAGFAASLQAMTAYASAGGQGGALRWARRGHVTLVALRRGPLLLVAVARTDEAPGELASQLARLHALLLAVLTSAFERALARRPTFDLRSLLGGCGALLDTWVDASDASAAGALGAWAPLALDQRARAAASHALAAAAGRARCAGVVLAAALAPGGRVAALAHPSGAAPHVGDVALLAHFVAASADSFRAGDEALSPLCLPHADRARFAHVHVTFARADAAAAEGGGDDGGARGELAVVLVAGGAAAREPEALEALSAAAGVARERLAASGVLEDVAEAVADGGGGGGALDAAVAPPSGPVLQWALHAASRGQVATATVPRGGVGAAEAVAAYKRVRALALPQRDELCDDGRGAGSDGGGGSTSGEAGGGWDGGAVCASEGVQRFFFASPRGEGEPAAALLTSPPGDLYVALDALVTRRRAMAACQELAARLRQREATLLAESTQW